MEFQDSQRNSAIETVESALLAHSTHLHQQSHGYSPMSSDTTLVLSTSHQNTMSAANSNTNGGMTIARERYHSFGRGGAGNLRRPSDQIFYTPSSQRSGSTGSPPGGEGQERRRSSLFSAFSIGSVGEPEGGARRNSSVWKNSVSFWAKRRESIVEVAVDD
ncbi:MAG: hypothetical protein M1840_004504 [Geoglossum simile]|nr:MAG: hypothetical protein M1840_004504 [Geoglossum simile]